MAQTRHTVKETKTKKVPVKANGSAKKVIKAENVELKKINDKIKN